MMAASADVLGWSGRTVEASVGQLVAERVRATGDPEGKVVAVLSDDPAAVARVAADGRVAASELSSELQEFRLEVKEGLGNLDKKMQEMLAGRDGDKEELAAIATAVNAAAARDEELLRAVEASAARDDAILAAVEAGATRDADLKQQVQGLSDSLRRKTKKESVRQLKDAPRALRASASRTSRSRLCGHQISGAPRRRRDVLSAQ